MDAELFNKGELEVKLTDGKLILEVGSKGATIMAEVDPEYFIDKLTAAIPGEIDDNIAKVFKAALKM